MILARSYQRIQARFCSCQVYRRTVGSITSQTGLFPYYKKKMCDFFSLLARLLCSRARACASTALQSLSCVACGCRSRVSLAFVWSCCFGRSLPPHNAGCPAYRTTPCAAARSHRKGRWRARRGARSAGAVGAHARGVAPLVRHPAVVAAQRPRSGGRAGDVHAAAARPGAEVRLLPPFCIRLWPDNSSSSSLFSFPRLSLRRPRRNPWSDGLPYCADDDLVQLRSVRHAPRDGQACGLRAAPAGPHDECVGNDIEPFDESLSFTGAEPGGDGRLAFTLTHTVRAGPRSVVYFDPATVRAAVATVGGLCPGARRRRFSRRRKAQSSALWSSFSRFFFNQG